MTKMLLDEIKTIKSSKKDLRSFAVTLGVFFGLAGAFLFWRGKAHSFIGLSVSSFFLAFGFLAPQFLKPIQKIWMTLALLMGWVMTRIILTVLFYGLITPIAQLARLSGKKFLNTAFREDVNSYWMIRKQKEAPKENYEKQFQ